MNEGRQPRPPRRCEIFGSYATGLYVPTSDIDLVILDSGCTNIQAGLKGLAAALAKRKVGRAIQVGGKGIDGDSGARHSGGRGPGMEGGWRGEGGGDRVGAG